MTRLDHLGPVCKGAGFAVVAHLTDDANAVTSSRIQVLLKWSSSLFSTLTLSTVHPSTLLATMASTNVLGVSPDTPGKLAKELAFPFLIAAKAAILDKPQWLPSESWWNREGDAWLKSLAERVSIV